MIKEGANVNAFDNDLEYWDPLIHASRNGHKEVAELLIANGADVKVWG